MSLNLKTRYDLSINDLSTISRSRLLRRTPHVGNTVLRDLFVAQCEFPILWVDSTIPLRDGNANPHVLIRNGVAVTVADGGQPLDRMLTLDAQVTAEGLEEYGFICGQPLTDGHLNRLRSVFPNTSVNTISSFYCSNEERLREVLEVATDALPRRWYRFVREDGTVRTFKSTEKTGVRSWADIQGHLRLRRGEQGWVVPNPFAILFDAVQQSIETGAPEAWLLSGPDMVDYLPGLIPDLQIAYEAVRRRLNYPELTIHLVPFGCFRFAVRKSHQDNLDRLLQQVWEDPRDRSKRSAFAAECPDLWVRTERQGYFSQHDMTCPDDLYVPAQLKHLPLGAVQLLWEVIHNDLPKEHR